MAIVWLVAAIWVGVLLALYVTVWQGSGPPPTPEATHLGLRGTVYHLIGLYVGAVLVLLLAYGPPSRSTVAAPPTTTEPPSDRGRPCLEEHPG